VCLSLLFFFISIGGLFLREAGRLFKICGAENEILLSPSK